MSGTAMPDVRSSELNVPEDPFSAIITAQDTTVAFSLAAGASTPKPTSTLPRPKPSNVTFSGLRLFVRNMVLMAREMLVLTRCPNTVKSLTES